MTINTLDGVAIFSDAGLTIYCDLNVLTKTETVFNYICRVNVGPLGLKTYLTMW